jgi:hypothetical protein
MMKSKFYNILSHSDWMKSRIQVSVVKYSQSLTS